MFSVVCLFVQAQLDKTGKQLRFDRKELLRVVLIVRKLSVQLLQMGCRLRAELNGFLSLAGVPQRESAHMLGSGQSICVIGLGRKLTSRLLEDIH